MTKGIDKDFLEKLKSKSDIVSIVSGYLPLTRKGKSYWACCPFHHEKTPSFCIDGEGQFYHCFGCGVGGDVIKFVQEYESLDFMGTVRMLAERAKMELPETSYDAERVAKERREKERRLALMKDAARFYVTVFRSEMGEPQREYLKSRGVDAETAKNFGLGASPDFESLPAYLLKKGYTRDELLKTGVAGEKNGRIYDAIGGRLVFPVINPVGEVVAFGGRLMEKKPQFAKYKNTQETELFQKRKTLYNLNLVKKLKNETGLPYIIMVEGYMDTIALYSAGFKNVVASMGTSLTQDQARLLKRYTDTVVISYDGDFAGQKASLRGLEILENEGLKVKVAVLPDGLDPDDIIRTRGKQAYQDCLDQSLPLIDYKLFSLKRAYDLSTLDGRRDYTAEALKLIRTFKDHYLQEELLKRVRTETGISYESLRRDVEEDEPDGKKTAEPQTPQVALPVGDAELSAARFVLYALVTGKRYAAETDPDTFAFKNETHKKVADYVEEKRAAGESPNPSMLYEYTDDGEHDEVSRILAESRRETEDPVTEKKYYDDCVFTLKKIAIQDEIAALTELYRTETDLSRRKDLALLMQKKTRKLQELRP